jgi:integrase
MPRNITVSGALAEYERHLRARGLADNTVKNSMQALTAAQRVWGDIFVASIRPVHIDRYFQAHEWGPSTRNLYRGSLHQFFKWARNHGYMARDFDPLFGWRNERVPDEPRLRLDVSQFYPILDSVSHPRDRAALALGLFTFCRGSELVNMRINDLDLGNLTLDVYRVKTRQYDTMPVCEELRDEMVRWLNWYRQDQGQLVGSWYLVPSKKPDEWTWIDGSLTRIDRLAGLRPERKIGHPYTIPQRALAAMGYDVGREGFHTLRRSGARALFDTLRDSGVDGALMRVSSMLGHRDTKVTQHYIGLNMEREQRNSLLQGERMFPQLREQQGLRAVDNG